MKYLLFILISTLLFWKHQERIELNLWATYYYVPSVIHNEKGIALLDKNEQESGLKLDSSDWCKIAIEGTAIIKKNTQYYTLNYAGRSNSLQFDCRKCKEYHHYKGYEKTGKELWEQTSGIGKGVKNYDLIPYKTIAVDSTLIPYGSSIYIPDAKGIKYKSREGKYVVHDGIFFAGDTGSMIKGNHIDVFIGTDSLNPFTFIKSSPKEQFKAYILSK